MLLPCAKNLSSEFLSDGSPWDWEPSTTDLARLRSLPKNARRQLLLRPDFEWNIYSCFRASIPTRMITADNPPVAIRAFAADYDAALSPQDALVCMRDQPHNLMPNFLEVTLGGKLRAVWLLEEEFNVASMGHADAFLKEIAKLVRAERLLPAYDDASTRSSQRWSNGGEWHELDGTQPISSTVLHGLSCDAAKHADFGRGEIDIVRVGEEVMRRFPNRWVGDFSLGATGVRFWDPRSDNPRGAFVTPTGCFCVTGAQDFITWDEIFGAGWVRENRAVQFGEAAQEVFFDGKKYWRKQGDSYEVFSRDDTLLYFASRGLTRKARRGELVSEAEQVLLHVQGQNRVEAAVPLIFRPTGMQYLNGSRILNISKLKALPPAPEAPSTDNFPWIWDFIQCLLRDEYSRNVWLAWMQRGYRGAYELKPTVGQAIFLCGPVSNGKSLLCTRIIAPLLGGAMSNPYDFLMKATQFNDDLFSSGLLAINDEDAPKTEREKEIFLQRVKSMVVNQRHQFHAKFGGRIGIEWIGGRIVITMNDDPKSAGMLIEVTGSTADKTMFFKTSPYGKVWPEKYDLEAKIAQELPHFAKWLLEGFAPPPEVLEPGTRAGVKSWHDPALVEMAKQQEAAYELRELLVTWFSSGVYWNDDKTKDWCGTPTDLFSMIGISPDMVALLKDWSVQRIARSLRSLAGLEDGSVAFVQGSQREYRIDKEAIARKHQIHEEVAKEII